MKVTKKQELFCLEYLKDLNATQAAIRAGYSEKTARAIGQENLTKPAVAEFIEKAMEERSERAMVDSTYVLNRLHEIDMMDVADILDDTGNIKPITDWPKVWRTSISGLDLHEILSGDTETIIKKIKWPDKVKNIELLGKHTVVQAWRERIEHDFSDRAAALMEARKRVESARQ